MSTSKRESYHHGDLRTALVRAGQDIIAEGGAAALSLRAAARRAGVSAMAPYRHFPDRAGLLAAIAADGLRQLTAQLTEADHKATSLEALNAQGVAYVAFAMKHPALFRLMFGPEQPCDHPELAEALSGCFAVLEARVAKTVDKTVAQDMTMACWAFVHGLACIGVDGRLPLGADAPEVLAARLGALLIKGNIE